MNISYFRKFFCSGLAAVITAVFILAGCAADNTSAPTNSKKDSGQGASGSKETIEFIYWAGAGGEEEGFKNLIAKFESENPNIKINAQQVPPPNSGDYYTKIQTRIAGDDAPDVFRIQY